MDQQQHIEATAPDAVAGSSLPVPQSLVKPMTAVIRVSALVAAVTVPLAMVIGWLVAGSQGLWGALLGSLVPLFFFGTTAATALVTARLRPQLLGVVVLSTWLLKIVVLIAFLALIRDADFYDKGVLFVTLLVGSVLYLVMEALVVTKTKVLYLETEFAPPTGR